ncbi:DNA cross-link repair 1A protein [Daphnia magna]|uniref:DNA cross-link repair 1A protein n=1 Tax=Daphnia magna TaxID=35525 RepID=UPI001402B6F1|nr:DNA cross-link repair 1A protein [Daphnia magna]
MPNSSESDESVFEPRSGLRKSNLPGCDESIAPTCSSLPSSTSQKLKTAKLSLSQRKRHAGTSFGREDESFQIDNSVCQSGTVNPNFARQNNLLDSPPRKKSKTSRFCHANFSSSSDEDIPPSQNVPKKIHRRSDRLDASLDCPSSGRPSQEVVPSPSILLSPIKCRQGTRCQNESQAHFAAYVHLDSSPSVESLASTVVSLGILENDQEDIAELDDRVKAADIQSKPADESKLNVPSIQLSSFSANSSTKEDFVQHWVDSCEIEAFDNISVDSETQPLPEMLPDPLASAPNISVENHEREEILSQNELICQPTTYANLESHQPTPSRGMVTPLKKNQSSAVKPSTSSSKQSEITAFFTPCNTTPAKLKTNVDISQVQSHTAIKELNTTLTNDCELQPEPDETTVDELEVTVVKKDISTSGMLSHAKEQWSYIMSRMKMRGSATNLRREMKNVEKEKALQEPKQKNFTKPTVEAGPSTTDRKCPFYKRIPGTGFVVDAFCYGTVAGVSSYFLSHFHYDHYRGLGKWLKKPLYCSQVTANLINLKMKLDPGIIRVLPLNESRVIENIEVILIDANHCPGSVMFLFRFPTGKVVLHVGDFRAHPSMERLYELKQRPIDELYLDTTYCDEHYELPAQEEVLSYIRRLVRRYANKHQKLLVVSGTYTIGKEKVFMTAAEELNSKVWAPTEKRRILNCLEDFEISDRLSNDPLEAGVHVVNMGDIKPANLKQYLDNLKGSFTHILALNPTGWEYDGRMALKGLDAIPPKSYHNSIFIHGVPYSEHSGFSEMKRFVRFFRPRKIIPTVNVGSAAQRHKMETIFTEWLGHSARY